MLGADTQPLPLLGPCLRSWQTAGCQRWLPAQRNASCPGHDLVSLHALWAQLAASHAAWDRQGTALSTAFQPPCRWNPACNPHSAARPFHHCRELYYWDSYWVLQGLLVCGMTETATSQVRDLMTLLQDYGHVPNGARRYYLNRR